MAGSVVAAGAVAGAAGAGEGANAAGTGAGAAEAGAGAAGAGAALFPSVMLLSCGAVFLKGFLSLMYLRMVLMARMLSPS